MATKALSFDVGDYVVYPKHGVGRVVELQSTEIAGTRLELYVLRFEKEKMTLRVPVNKADSVGMRKLSSDKTMKDALETLKGKPKVKRTMWSRRAQEYEAKINSGDLTSIAEVTRDLFRPDDAPEQSYSERQIFEAASSRLARELGAMEQTDEKSALAKILEILNKAALIHHKAQGRRISRVALRPLNNQGRPSPGALSFVHCASLPSRIQCCNTLMRRVAMPRPIAIEILDAIVSVLPQPSRPPATTTARDERDYRNRRIRARSNVTGPFDVDGRTGAGSRASSASGPERALENFRVEHDGDRLFIGCDGEGDGT